MQVLCSPMSIRQPGQGTKSYGSLVKLLAPIVVSADPHFSAHLIIQNIKAVFRNQWLSDITQSLKLEYSKTHKQQFWKEPRLRLSVKNPTQIASKMITIGTSTTCLQFGRYSNIHREHRYCSCCKLSHGRNSL